MRRSPVQVRLSAPKKATIYKGWLLFLFSYPFMIPMFAVCRDVACYVSMVIGWYFETLHATSLRKAVVGVMIEIPRYDVSTIMDG